MRKALKIIGYTLGGIFLLIILAVLYLQTSWGKELVRSKLVEFLQGKFETEVHLAKIKYQIPRSVGFEGLILLDQQQDTLLAVGDLNVKINMLALIFNKVEVNELKLENVNGNISRSAPDSTFNFNYIIEAFAGDAANETSQEVVIEDTTGSSMTFDVKKVDLKNIRFQMNDTSGGTFFHLDLQELMLRPTSIDLEESNFEVNDLVVKGLKSSFNIDTSYLTVIEDTDTGETDFKLKVRQIHLEEIQFAMTDKTDSTYMNYEVGLFKTELKYFGLMEALVELGDLQLDETNGTIVFGKSTKAKIKEEIEPEEESSDWKVIADNIILNRINFAFDDHNEQRIKSGIDYAHLNISDFHVNIEDVIYKTDTISGNLKHLALQEQSGLRIMELRSKILYHNQGATLEDLYLLTPYTLLQDKIVVSYDSLGSLDQEMGKMNLAIDLNRSKVGFFDLLLFLPADQQAQFLPYKNQFLALDLNLNGPLESLLIDRFEVEGLTGTKIDLKGRLRGLPDAENLFYDLNLTTIRSTSFDLNPFLPDSLKQQILLPEWMNITGQMKGGMEDYFPNLLIQTADGNVKLDGFLSMSKGTDREEYNLAISTEKLDLGKILRQADTVLGVVDFEAHAQGVGFDPKKMKTKFDAKILSAWALGYPYEQIEFLGSIEESKALFNGFSKDPNLDFELIGGADFENEYPGVYADLKMKYIDLFALKLTEDTMNFSGVLLADFDSVNPDYPYGNLLLSGGRLQMPGNNAFLDTLIFTSEPEDSSQNIYLNASNFLYASLTGNIPLSKIGTSFTSHIDRHFHLKDTTIQEEDYQYNMELDALITYHPLLKNFAPDLQPFDTIQALASMDAESLNLNAYIPSIIYGGHTLDSGFVNVNENKDTFNYRLGLKKYTSETMELFQPTISGLIRNDSIYTLVNIKDSADENQFTLGGTVYQNMGMDSSLLNIKMFSGLRFNYNRWDVNPNNQIVLMPEGFYIQDFEISKGQESIVIQSAQANALSPLEILIRNFELANITAMMSKDTLLAEGQLNVKGNVDLSDSFPKMDINLDILNLKAFEQPVGELKVKANNENSNDYKANLTLTGNGNNLQLDGYYYLQPVNRNNFDFKLDIQPLSLKSLEGLTFGAIRNSSGGLIGNLHIQGTTDRPLIIGEVDFLKLTTTITALNAPFTFQNERISFERNNIALNNFKIEDLNGRNATIDGNIRTRNYQDFIADLTFQANRWQPIKSTKRDNEEFYGKLILSSNIALQGSLTSPQVDGTLTIHDSTDITYAMIDSGPGIVEHEGIVTFVDSRDTTFVDSSQTIVRRNRRGTRAMELNVNVAVEKDAKIAVLIDPSSGDMLQVQGKADLNAFLAPDGSIGLTGNYELEDGFYELNYNFLVRKFEIQKGSRITLAGDPLDAEADITAVYEANIAPYDLVEKQASPEQLVYYKQRLPFEVLLKIKGPAMKPEITFDISLPEGKANMVSTEVSNLVQAKLAEIRTDPSQMNKQVFAVLILNRFIAEDPFSSGTGGGMEYAVRQSVSRFLSDQLNNITQGLIEGFELNLDLESSEDYSTGARQNRTDLNVSASKNLLNDRMKVTVGNNFELEGQSTQKNSSVIPGNIAIDYDLSRDGKYQIRAYRSNELRNIVDGYTIETGVNFRVALEYNRFKYIFINRRKLLKNIQERRREEGRARNSEESDDEVSLNK